MCGGLLPLFLNLKTWATVLVFCAWNLTRWDVSGQNLYRFYKPAASSAELHLSTRDANPIPECGSR
jgi:hypothetical protein